MGQEETSCPTSPAEEPQTGSAPVSPSPDGSHSPALLQALPNPQITRQASYKRTKNLQSHLKKSRNPYKQAPHQHMPRIEVTSPCFQAGQGVTPNTFFTRSAISVSRLQNCSYLHGPNQGKAEQPPGLVWVSPAHTGLQREGVQFDDEYTTTLQQRRPALLCPLHIFLQETFLELFTPGVELVQVPSLGSCSRLTSQIPFLHLQLTAASKKSGRTARQRAQQQLHSREHARRCEKPVYSA